MGPRDVQGAADRCGRGVQPWKRDFGHLPRVPIRRGMQDAITAPGTVAWKTNE